MRASVPPDGDEPAGAGPITPRLSDDPVLQALLAETGHDAPPLTLLEEAEAADAEHTSAMREGAAKGPGVGVTKGMGGGVTKGIGNPDSPESVEEEEQETPSPAPLEQNLARRHDPAWTARKQRNRYPTHKEARAPSVRVKDQGGSWYRFLLRAFALPRLKDQQYAGLGPEPVDELAAAVLAFGLSRARPGQFLSEYELGGLSRRQRGLTLEDLHRIAGNAASAALAYHDPERVQGWREDGRRGGLASAATRQLHMKAPLDDVARLRKEGNSKAAIAAALDCSEPTIARRLRELAAREARLAQINEPDPDTGTNGSTGQPEPAAHLPGPPTSAPTPTSTPTPAPSPSPAPTTPTPPAAPSPSPAPTTPTSAAPRVPDTDPAWEAAKRDNPWHDQDVEELLADLDPVDA